MQIKLLKSLVEEIAGANSPVIVDILFNKDDVNEFLIAKKMGLTINQVRNILYKLSAEDLVSFIRKKDKRKGWYIYFWTLNTEKCLVRLEQSLIKKIEDLSFQLKSRQQKRFYECKPCHIEVTEETALAHDFSCEECAEIYTLAENDKPIKEIMGKIARRESELKLIKEELVNIRGDKEKKKQKKEKKDIKAKEKLKKEKKEARAKEKKKLGKLTGLKAKAKVKKPAKKIKPKKK